jgi:hypothetical protein
MDRIDWSWDSDVVIKNKLFNNIQKCRVDVEIMRMKKKVVDIDTIKAARALARDIEVLKERTF